MRTDNCSVACHRLSGKLWLESEGNSNCGGVVSIARRFPTAAGKALGKMAGTGAELSWH